MKTTTNSNSISSNGTFTSQFNMEMVQELLAVSLGIVLTSVVIGFFGGDA
jgi:hypothetical protein